MIEGAVACLEKRGFRFSYATHGTPLRSYRRLHSAFWSHGAGSIDMPAWWIALLQLPQTKEAPEAVQEDTKPRFLEFLYPSQALAFIQKNIGTDSAVVGRQRQIVTAHQRSRAYASLTTDSLLDPSDCATPVEAKEFAQQLADEEISGDKTRAEGLQTELDNLLLTNNHATDLSKAWKVYLEMQSLALKLHPRQIFRFLRCLARSLSKVDSERLLGVFGSLPIAGRKSMYYRYAISAALNNDKFEAAVRFHSEALLGKRGSMGTCSLLSYMVKRRSWQVAVETWQPYWNHKEGNVESSNIWVKVDKIPLPQLWDSTLSAIDFAAGLTALADSGAAAAAREFALQLTLRSFALHNTNGLKQEMKRYGARVRRRHLKPDSVIEVEYPNVDKQRQLFDKATSLQAPTYELYESAIRQALSFGTGLYITQALKLYQTLRANAHITPTPHLLEALLRQVCEIRSQAGISLILDDYRYYHGSLSSQIYELAIHGFSIQGHNRAVEVLLEEYCLQYGKITSSFIANSILVAYNRRGQVNRVVETFKTLEDRYGFKPDQTSFDTVIATHARVGDAEGASTWYNSLLDSGFKPTHRILLSLMAMFAKRGDLEVVKQLLRQSETSGIKISVSMINTLVLAHVTNGELAEAERLVNEALEIAEGSQESRTRMWNYLLNAFAMRADLQKVVELHQRMRENEIPSNAVSLAALMRSLATVGKPRAAYNILTDVLPQLGITANSLHYATCMSGYFKHKTYNRVFDLYSEMLEKGIEPNPAVYDILIRAAAGIDAEGLKQSTTGSDQQTYERARKIFSQAMKDLDPTVLATTNPMNFVGPNRLDESFTSSYFSFLIFLYGKQGALNQVEILYDWYSKVKLDLNMDVESIPPIQMLSALMLVELQIRNHDRVDHYWELSLKGARKLANRVGAKYSEPGWVLPARRFIVNIHLRYYMRSLADRSKYDEISKVIEHLHYCGFELDSRSWNFYIKTLVWNQQVLLAFKLCEKELMPSWADRRKPRMGIGLARALRRRAPGYLEPHRRMLAYDTLVVLTAAFMELRSSVGAEEGMPTVQHLKDVAPRTVDVVRRLPRIDDRLQRAYLGYT